MEGRRNHRARAALAAAVALLAVVPTGAVAVTHDATSHSGGVTVNAGKTTDGSGGSNVAGAGPNQNCISMRQKATAAQIPHLLPDGYSQDALYVSVFCDGVFVGNEWIEPGVVDVGAAARAEAQRWVDTVPVPTPTIVTAPPTEAITGLPTWFWTSGYTGEPITASLSALGHPVEVRMTAGTATWHFGDGTTSTGTLGQADTATVSHTYTTRSTADDPDGAHRLQVTLDLHPAYRVDGGPWQDLDPITVDATRDLVVREIQAVGRTP